MYERSSECGVWFDATTRKRKNLHVLTNAIDQLQNGNRDHTQSQQHPQCASNSEIGDESTITQFKNVRLAIGAEKVANANANAATYEFSDTSE